VVFPLIHPDASRCREAVGIDPLSSNRGGGRCTYVCDLPAGWNGSWMTWGPTGPQQVVMVKHMTRLIKDEQVVLSRQPARVSIEPSRITASRKEPEP